MSDPANEAVSVMMSFGSSTVPVAKDLAELLLDALKTITEHGFGITGDKVRGAVHRGVDHLDGIGHAGKVSMANLVSENKELIAIPIERRDLKTLENQLKGYKVTFAVMEDPITGSISIHAKAQDYDRIEMALKAVIKDMVRDDVPEKAPEASAETAQEANVETVAETERAPAADAPVQTPDIDTRPATEPQEQFIDALYEKGVISDSEIAAFRANPTVANANALLNVHRDNASFIDLGNQDKKATEAVPWSEPVSVTIEEREGAPAQATLSTKQLEDFKLEAYSNGQACIIDAQGKTVWSGYTMPGNLQASERLAERGLTTHLNKESLRLNVQEGPTPSQKFDQKLDRAEETAAKIAKEVSASARSPHRIKENARG